MRKYNTKEGVDVHWHGWLFWRVYSGRCTSGLVADLWWAFLKASGKLLDGSCPDDGQLVARALWVFMHIEIANLTLISIVPYYEPQCVWLSSEMFRKYSNMLVLQKLLFKFYSNHILELICQEMFQCNFGVFPTRKNSALPGNLISHESIDVTCVQSGFLHRILQAWKTCLHKYIATECT